jgi:hypothetical protein
MSETEREVTDAEAEAIGKLVQEVKIKYERTEH